MSLGCAPSFSGTRGTPTNPNPGTLRDSMRILETVDDSPTFGGAIGSDLDYAGFTDEIDTQPHVIEARRHGAG